MQQSEESSSAGAFSSPPKVFSCPSAVHPSHHPYPPTPALTLSSVGCMHMEPHSTHFVLDSFSLHDGLEIHLCCCMYR